MIPPILFIFAGPSATGKSTTEETLLERIPSLSRFIIDTSRKQRDGEIDGIHYNFVSPNPKKDFFYKIEITPEWKYFYSLDEFKKYSPKIVSVIEVKKALETKKALIKAIPDAKVFLFGFTHPQEKRVSLLRKRGETRKNIEIRLQREEVPKVFNLCDQVFDVISNKNDINKLESLVNKEIVLHENKIFNDYQRYTIPTP